MDFVKAPLLPHPHGEGLGSSPFLNSAAYGILRGVAGSLLHYLSSSAGAGFESRVEFLSSPNCGKPNVSFFRLFWSSPSGAAPLTSFLRSASVDQRRCKQQIFLLTRYGYVMNLPLGISRRLVMGCRDQYVFFSAAAQANILRSLHVSRPPLSLENGKTGSHPRLYSYNPPHRNRIASRAVSLGKNRNPRSRPQTLPNPKQQTELVLVNGSPVKNAKKECRCTFSGCGRSYSKPCRVEEHERSHTAEVRPAC